MLGTLNHLGAGDLDRVDCWKSGATLPESPAGRQVAGRRCIMLPEIGGGVLAALQISPFTARQSHPLRYLNVNSMESQK